MKNIITILVLTLSISVFSQIEQNVNKTAGTESNPINEIDSIRFNGGLTEMQIILNNGITIIHTIGDIDNVTFTGQLIGEIDVLDCTGATINGTLVEGVVVSSVSAVIDYTGGNGGPHNGQTVASTGVTGLTAEQTAGNFATGAGTLTYEITGTPNSSGTASFAIQIGGMSCILEITVDSGSVSTIDCAAATINGTLVANIAASGVSAEIDYTGGNGGPHNGQTLASTGVTGLTATLSAGNFANGTGTLTYEITGSPNSSGTTIFTIQIGGLSCILEITVESSTYPLGTVHCDPANPTAIVNVTNPTTGKIWMDRNLGATQVATSSTDQAAYGDLYQWGRRSDGHQCRTSPTTTTLSSTDQPGHGDFILVLNFPWDWRSTQNINLWQGTNGINNPCPAGYRLPTETELSAERTSWSSNNATGAFASPLKLPLAGRRLNGDGSLVMVGTDGFYWSSTVSGFFSLYLEFNSSIAFMNTNPRAYGRSVRCLKD